MLVCRSLGAALQKGTVTTGGAKVAREDEGEIARKSVELLLQEVVGKKTLQLFSHNEKVSKDEGSSCYICPCV